MDALGSAIRIDSRGREVMRILPRINEAINEEWISDKTRHVVDGLKTQRLDRPYVRVDGKLQAGDLAARPSPRSPPRPRRRRPDAHRRDRRRSRQRRGDVRAEGADGQARRRQSSTAGRTARSSIRNSAAPPICSIRPIAGIDEADAIMIIGSNPRLEAPVLNARIRKRWLKGDCLIGVVGRRST